MSKFLQGVTILHILSKTWEVSQNHDFGNKKACMVSLGFFYETPQIGRNHIFKLITNLQFLFETYVSGKNGTCNKFVFLSETWEVSSKSLFKLRKLLRIYLKPSNFRKPLFQTENRLIISLSFCLKPDKLCKTSISNIKNNNNKGILHLHFVSEIIVSTNLSYFGQKKKKYRKHNHPFHRKVQRQHPSWGS